MAEQQTQTRRGQTILEYTLVLGLVAAVMITMGVFIRRSSQAMIKLVADQVGNQVNAEQTKDAQFGYLIAAEADSSVDQSQSVTQTLGATEYVYGPNTTVSKNLSLTNQGFAPNFEFE